MDKRAYLLDATPLRVFSLAGLAWVTDRWPVVIGLYLPRQKSAIIALGTRSAGTGTQLDWLLCITVGAFCSNPIQRAASIRIAQNQKVALSCKT